MDRPRQFFIIITLHLKTLNDLQSNRWLLHIIIYFLVAGIFISACTAHITASLSSRLFGREKHRASIRKQKQQKIIINKTKWKFILNYLLDFDELIILHSALHFDPNENSHFSVSRHESLDTFFSIYLVGKFYYLFLIVRMFGLPRNGAKWCSKTNYLLRSASVCHEI